MKKILTSLLLVVISISIIGCKQNKEYVIDINDSLQSQNIDDNYRTFYQIFIGSFSDSNNDGIGDLKGIIKRFDYLNDGDPNSGKSLGINGIWLSPIHQASTYHKYDVISYKSIDQDFGTLDDFKELVKIADERSVNIILDLVINHTSKYHSWFTKAKEAYQNNDTSSKYYDYYCIVKESEKEPHKTYYPFVGEYFYEANFDSSMPELNFNSSYVKAEIIDILKYWIDLGVSGFRIDAAKYIFLGENTKNIEFWNWFMIEAKKLKEDIYVVGEVWSQPSEVLEYYQSINCFDFQMSGQYGLVELAAKASIGVNEYLTSIATYYDSIKASRNDAILAPFISNHDMDRSGGYLSVSEYLMQMAANLYMLSPGNAYIYYGEEIGMKGTRGTANTDANRRLAMLWGDKDTIANPIGATYDTSLQTNGTVASQLGDMNSLYNHYKKLIILRNANKEILRGTFTPIDFKDNFTFGGYLAHYQDSTVGVFHNTSNKEIIINLADYIDIDFESLRGYAGKGVAKLEGSILTLDGMTSVVLK